ncbi:MAG TPA: NAD(P)H-dependent oxidoreductase [Woeseiaceae bacterium]
MTQYQIGVVVGSLRRESFNRKLANGVIRLGPPEFAFRELEIGDQPLYNQDTDRDQPEAVKRLKSEIRECQGILFVTPEYNRSMPGVLKNALDNASRPYGDSAWAGKPCGIMGVSSGQIGTACAQQHLRDSLAYLDMPVLGQPEVYITFSDELINADGSIGAGSRDFLKGWMDRFAAWVKLHAT